MHGRTSDAHRNGATDSTIMLTVGREIKPFDEYLLNAMSIRISRVSMNVNNRIEQLQNDTVRSVFSGLCSVQAVTEDGQEAMKKVKVRNAQLRYKGETSDIVPSGSMIQATFSNDGYVYTIGPDTLSAEITADLSGLIRSEGGLLSGTIMNPNKPVRIGDEWPIDTTAFAATLGPPPEQKQRHTSGTVTLVRIDSLHGHTVALVRMNAHVVNAFDNINGTQADDAIVDAVVEIAVPLDERYPAVWASSNTTMTATLVESGQRLRVEYIVADEFDFIR